MHKVTYTRNKTFTYTTSSEYPYLYTFTLTFQKGDINHLEKFKHAIGYFEKFHNANVVLKMARCVNNKEGIYHTKQLMQTHHTYHFHGFVASKEKLDLNAYYKTQNKKNFYITECDTIKYYENFIDYINNYHVITAIFKGFSF